MIHSYSPVSNMYNDAAKAQYKETSPAGAGSVTGVPGVSLPSIASLLGDGERSGSGERNGSERSERNGSGDRSGDRSETSERSESERHSPPYQSRNYHSPPQRSPPHHSPRDSVSRDPEFDYGYLQGLPRQSPQGANHAQMAHGASNHSAPSAPPSRPPSGHRSRPSPAPSVASVSSTSTAAASGVSSPYYYGYPGGAPTHSPHAHAGHAHAGAHSAHSAGAHAPHMHGVHTGAHVLHSPMHPMQGAPMHMHMQGMLGQPGAHGHGQPHGQPHGPQMHGQPQGQPHGQQIHMVHAGGHAGHAGLHSSGHPGGHPSGQPHGHPGGHPAAAAFGYPRPRQSQEIKRRTKTGCLTCRKRRIKCDEQHPMCKNCSKSERICLGYDPILQNLSGDKNERLQKVQAKRRRFAQRQKFDKMRIISLVEQKPKDEPLTWPDVVDLFRAVTPLLDELFDTRQFSAVALSVSQQLSQPHADSKVIAELELIRQFVAIIFADRDFDSLDALGLGGSLEKLRTTADYTLVRALVEALTLEDSSMHAAHLADDRILAKLMIVKEVVFRKPVSSPNPVDGGHVLHVAANAASDPQHAWMTVSDVLVRGATPVPVHGAGAVGPLGVVVMLAAGGDVGARLLGRELDVLSRALVELAIEA